MDGATRLKEGPPERKHSINQTDHREIQGHLRSLKREKCFLCLTKGPRGDDGRILAEVLTKNTASKDYFYETCPLRAAAGPEDEKLFLRQAGKSGGLHRQSPHCSPEVPAREDQNRVDFFRARFLFSQGLRN